MYTFKKNTRTHILINHREKCCKKCNISNMADKENISLYIKQAVLKSCLYFIIEDLKLFRIV